MNKKWFFALAVCLCGVTRLHAQGTAFTYQGRLLDQGNASNGRYDIEFGLWDALSGGARVAGPVTNSAVSISNGLFTVTVDFGSGAFNGNSRWLQIALRTNGSVAAFAPVTPRQVVTPAPYAVLAGGLNGVLPDAQLSANIPRLNANQTFSGNVSFTGPGNVGIGTSSPLDAKLDVEGNLRINDNNLFLRSNADRNHGIGYRSNAAGRSIDGPFVFGFNGGALGVAGPDSVSLAWTWTGDVWVSNNLDTASLNVRSGLTIDAGSTNNGSYYPGLVFGAGSGETISSRRTSGGNQYGIDFYTGFSPRMSIANNGNVGIGTTTPGGKLDINVGAGAVQFRNEGGLTPGLNISGGYFGTMRFRNALEIWPDDAGTRAGYLDVRDTNGAVNIVLRGNGTATVKVLEVTGGADIAEPFQMSSAEIPKGAVVIIDEEHPGQLKLSDRAYDTRVAGIVSGANGINPGLALHQQGKLEGGQNVALTGRVFALADATHGAIRPGDLLTTSDTPGHVMKATDRALASGSILGKAMTNLKEGKGTVLVLVSLQ